MGRPRKRYQIKKTGNILSGLLKGLTPIERLSVSEWAQRHRKLSSTSSAEPGPWKNERVPYAVEIMNCFNPHHEAKTVVVMKGSQVGTTELMFNVMGYYISQDPCPMLYVMPTEDNVKRNSKIRFDPMIEASEILREKVATQAVKSKDNSVLQKAYPGGVMMFCGANSPAPLRSVPVRIVILDEVDAMPTDVSGEGSPISLAMARTRTFANKKIGLISTPTKQGASMIEAEFLSTSQRRYFVPCPDCGLLQTLEFERLRKLASGAVVYECDGCSHQIQEREKPWMFKNGQWQDTVPENKSRTKIGFHLSSMYSPLGWYSWVQMIDDYEEALKDETKMITFTNTVLGETYAVKGEAPEWEQLFARRENYPTYSPPKDVKVITAGVDVQADRLEVEIVGWCVGRRSYSIDYRVFVGDTSDINSDAWHQLSELLAEEFTREDGVLLTVEKMAVDSGFQTTVVYDFCRRYHPSRVIPVKGQENQSVILTPPRPVDRSGTKGTAGTLGLWNVGVSILKQEVYSWLRLKPNEDGTYPDGYCHFPSAYDSHYFRMLTAESLEKKIERGFPKYVWVKNYPRNEALDCRVYARAAAASFGLDRWKPEDYEAHEASKYSRSEPARQSAEAAGQRSARSQRGGRSGRGGFWGK